MANPIASMTAVVDGKTYDLTPARGCTGCAFSRQCSKDRDAAPEYNDYVPCADLDVIYKKRRSK